MPHGSGAMVETRIEREVPATGISFPDSPDVPIPWWPSFEQRVWWARHTGKLAKFTPFERLLHRVMAELTGPDKRKFHGNHDFLKEETGAGRTLISAGLKVLVQSGLWIKTSRNHGLTIPEEYRPNFFHPSFGVKFPEEVLRPYVQNPNII